VIEYWNRCKYWGNVMLVIAELYLSDAEIEKLHDFEEECVEDYFQKKQITAHVVPEERLRATGERFVLLL
jgi:hypothetical protein